MMMKLMIQQVRLRWFCNVILLLFLFHSCQNKNKGGGGRVHALIEIRVVDDDGDGPPSSVSSSSTSTTTTTTTTTTSSLYSYSIIDYSATTKKNKKNTTLFEGGDIAVFMEGKWCVSSTPSSTSSSSSSSSKTTESINIASTTTNNINKLIPSSKRNIHGYQKGLGLYHGLEIVWNCNLINEKITDDDDQQQQQQQHEVIPIITTFKNFDSGLAVIFELEWPNGANKTNLTDFNKAMTNFPSLRRTAAAATTTQPQQSVLSWHGSFIQSIKNYSIGPTGGPTIFYNSSDPNLKNVIVGSPFSTHHNNRRSNNNKNNNEINYWKTFTAGNNQDWSGKATTTWWSPGTSGRIQNIPKGFKQSFILYQGKHGGITPTVAEWGNIMKLNSIIASQQKNKLSDITISKIGYQTDNGAMYCFCKDKNCSQTIIDEIQYLKSNGIPMGYLSFQGAGTSSGRGTAAPWCVDTWGVDPGGLDKNHYPLSIEDMQKQLDIPLQLYAPYFCPNSTYFQNQQKQKQNNNNNNNSRGSSRHSWISVQSDTTLPGCQYYNFENVIANQSKEFYNWFFNKGITKANMISFESDFMNQNFNCVPNFIHSIQEDGGGADVWLNGMSSAAFDNNITIQWCYATPSDVLSSIDMPSVTNFRVSYDFCYGRSYDIGESSLLVWSLGSKPSKDTLWSTTNNHTSIPGCPWTLDHEKFGAELHVVLALMSTGPVGISDAIGMTNTTLLQRTIRMDGTLLQPTKAITAVDSTFIKKKSAGGLLLDYDDNDDDGGGGYLYGTAGLGPSWIFVSFKMKEEYGVTLTDFYPPLVIEKKKKKREPAVVVLAYRQFNDGTGCQDGTDAVSSGCIHIKSISFDDDNDDDIDEVDDGTINTVSLKSQQRKEEIFVVPVSDNSSPGSDFAPTITYVWKEMICNGSAWFFLGELNKYVPLSKNRFIGGISCLSSSSNGGGGGSGGGSGNGGLSVTVVGSVGEIVKLTALKREDGRGRTFPSQNEEEDEEDSRYKVVCKEVQIPHSRMIKVVFGGGTEETVKNDAGFTEEV